MAKEKDKRTGTKTSAKTAKAEKDTAKALAKAEKKLAKAQAELAAAKGEAAERDLIVEETAAPASLKIPPELSVLLKGAGKGWQQKAEAALALWLDEASLALRKDGFDGLSKTMKTMTGQAKAGAKSLTPEQRTDAVIRQAVDGIGRDIAGAALSAAFAAFTARSSASAPQKKDGHDKKPEPENKSENA